MKRQEAEEVLDHAARTQVQESDDVAIDDLVAAGKDVGLSKASVLQGVTKLEERLEKKRVARAYLRTLGLRAVACFVTLLVCWQAAVFFAMSSMQSNLSTIEYQHTRVRAQLDRQQEVESRWRDLPDSPERRAELAGSTNRVGIARNRYDRLVFQYNESADGLFGSRAASQYDLPTRVPLSNAITTW